MEEASHSSHKRNQKGLKRWIQGTPSEGGGSGTSLCREQEPQCVLWCGLLGLGGQE